MEDGALGVGSRADLPPAYYAKTDELVALCEVAARYRGIYISHMRNEGDREMEAIDELIAIARRAKIPAEIYHLKVAGQQNWGKLPEDQEDRSRARHGSADHGRHVHLHRRRHRARCRHAALGPGRRPGGLDANACRTRHPARVQKEMATPHTTWENLLLAAGPDKVLLVGFKSEKLKPLTGKTLGEVARMRGKSPEETAMDLVIEDDVASRHVYFLMSEDNVRSQIALPWVSFGSDAGTRAAEGVFLKSSAHPRAYGNVARVLARYVRDERLLPVEEAVRKMTSLPAANLGIRDRGLLKEGYFADIVVFDPPTIQDHATYEKPHQYATGVRGLRQRRPGDPGWRTHGSETRPGAAPGALARACRHGHHETALPGPAQNQESAVGGHIIWIPAERLVNGCVLGQAVNNSVESGMLPTLRSRVRTEYILKSAAI